MFAPVSDRAALITGASSGIGLAIARALGQDGYGLTVSARRPEKLEEAAGALADEGLEVQAVPANMAEEEDIKRVVEAHREKFGRLDVLVNNAGIITVGALPSLTIADFEQAMGVMFWGAVYPTLEVLPIMRDRGEGRIVNVTSIGGKISAPRLLAYNAAKFATVGFSEGLRAELAGTGVKVVTVVPGFMRTGSHVNAFFKGRPRQEYAWFSVGGTLPVTSISAEGAARRIAEATARGEAEVTMSPQAKLAARFAGLFPGLTADLLGVFHRLLPRPGVSTEARRGAESRSAVSESFLTALGRKAAARYQSGGDGAGR